MKAPKILFGRSHDGKIMLMIPAASFVAELDPEDAQRLSVMLDLQTERDVSPVRKVQIRDEVAGAERVVRDLAR